MSRFFNVKNDNSADGAKVVWDKPINVLQPEVADVLDNLRDGKEICLPLKSADKKEEEDTVYKASWLNLFYWIVSYISQFLSFCFGIKEPTIYDNYSSDVPLLEEHEKELSEIWSTIKSNGIITGRRTIRKLADNHQNCTYTLKKLKIGENQYYSLHQPYSFSEDTYTEPDKYEHIYATLIQSLSKTQYTGYFYQSMKHQTFTIHYTSEIDAHWNSEKFEIKILKDYGNHIPCSKAAFRAVLQCQYSDVKEIIFGFYTDTHITLKLFTCNELIQLTKIRPWIDEAKMNFKRSIGQIIKFIEEHGDELKIEEIVKITKTEGFKNNFVFDIQK